MLFMNHTFVKLMSNMGQQIAKKLKKSCLLTGCHLDQLRSCLNFVVVVVFLLLLLKHASVLSSIERWCSWNSVSHKKDSIANIKSMVGIGKTDRVRGKSYLPRIFISE